MGRLDVMRDVMAITVEAVGSVRATSDTSEPYALIDAGGQVVEVVREFLAELLARDSSPLTLRSYAQDLLRWWRFLHAVGVSWERAMPEDVRDYVLWMRVTGKVAGNRRPPIRPRYGVNSVTGKKVASAGYSPATINHAETVVHEFYRFLGPRGLGPVLNPAPRGRDRGDRRDAHHNPLDEFDRRDRSPYRQKDPRPVPRGMSDQQFDDVFTAMRSNRDRAMLALYVSSGVRASELLGMTGSAYDVAEQLICVRTKGSNALEWVPVASDAFVWLRLYQTEVGTSGPHDPLWVTLRRPHRALTYHAFRAVLQRANAVLDSNWTIHDLRHTAAHRMVESGMTLAEVQRVLRHENITTTQRYLVPRLRDLVAAVQAAHDRRSVPDPPVVAGGYDSEDLAVLFGSDRP